MELISLVFTDAYVFEDYSVRKVTMAKVIATDRGKDRGELCDIISELAS